MKRTTPSGNRTGAPVASEAPETVDPRWIITVLGALLAFGVLCSYVTICGLFARSQWQLVLHPSRAVTITPKDLGLRSDDVRFGPDASGQPQLTGWWIPADVAADPTVLLLHDGTGSMSDALERARTLHNARLNVLVFDYRGFGRSGGRHPNEALMENDTASALTYLESIRAVAPARLVVYGSGVGSSLATELCAQHKDLAALILENADGDMKVRVQNDPRSRFVPVGLLFHEDFPLAEPLRKLATPKLLVSTSGAITAPVAFARAASPKTTVELGKRSTEEGLHDAIRRFLDSYLPAEPEVLRLPR